MKELTVFGTRLAAIKMAPLLKHTEVDVNVAYYSGRVELVENDRIIDSRMPQCLQRSAALCRSLVQDELPAGNPCTSKRRKLAENSNRDVNIALAIDLSTICDKPGIDVWELIPLPNRHSCMQVLQPAAGVDGQCAATAEQATPEADIVNLLVAHRRLGAAMAGLGGSQTAIDALGPLTYQRNNND
jgi:hypothetical protein